MISTATCLMPQVIERISEDSEVDIEVKEMYTVLSSFNAFLFSGPRDKSQQMQREIERSLLILYLLCGNFSADDSNTNENEFY